MIERAIIAGFGGQGVMTIGKLLATVAMDQGKHVTYFPSYGAEVRGGTAHCHVVISDEEIYSPIVELADVLLLMNQPSYDRFRARLKPGGLLIMNASMANPDAALEAGSPAKLLHVPATEIASELGNVRVANVVMLGAYLAQRPVVTAEALVAGIEFAGKSASKAHLLEVNRKAFHRGLDLSRK